MIRSEIVNTAYFSNKYYNKNLLETIRGKIPNQEAPLSVATMNQTHSSTVLEIQNKGHYESDSILTSEKNLVLVVKTADCMPVLIRNTNSVAAVHIGWRGLANNIFNKTLEKMMQENLQVSIGPHAKSCCYEIKEDVGNLLPELTETRGNKLYLNQSKSIEKVCNKKNIDLEISDICTICNNDFFSYRENGTNERQVSLIWN
tara:strand:- start:3077 stop:3682 length:606 start_codon:yes stop_codon:yes gene_type:complete